MFEIDVEFRYGTEPNKSHGFAVLFTSEAPVFPQDFDKVTGFKPDFKGLGVFLYKSKTDGWKIIAM